MQKAIICTPCQVNNGTGCQSCQSTGRHHYEYPTGIHKETNDYFANGVPTGKLIPDKDGDHITAEFFRPKEKDWVVFHLYVKQVRNQGKLTYVPNNGVKNNPRIYFETKSATPTSVIKAGDKQETCRV